MFIYSALELEKGLELRLKNIKSAGFPISEIAFGGASLSGHRGGYGFGGIGMDESVELIEYSFHNGINLFDTAPIYGFNESELKIGKGIKSFRDKVFLITKGGVSWHPNGRVNMSNHPDIIHSMIEESLKNLDVDYIDHYMIHWPDKNVDIRKSLDIVQKYCDRGLIKSIGLCNTTLEELNLSKDVCEIDIVQSEFNLFSRPSQEVLDYCTQNNITMMGWGTFDKGILTGRVTKDRKFEKSDCRSWAPWWKKSNKDKKIDLMKDVLGILDERKISPIALALSILDMNELSISLCGFRNKNQLDTLLNAYRIKDNYHEEFKLVLEMFHEFNASH